MSDDCFDQLEADLARLTRAGAHLSVEERRTHRRGVLAKRFVTSALLTVALAASLFSEFPATASGSADASRVHLTQAL